MAHESGESCILRIAVHCPLRRVFDYLPPPDVAGERLIPGIRVRVPFHQSERLGILIATATTTNREGPLRTVLEILDEAPSLPQDILDLLLWAADYYHHPIGEVIWTALPACLRKAKKLRPPKKTPPPSTISIESGPVLSADQQVALQAIQNSQGFHGILLEGVTGSGKTEVYIEATRHCLDQGRQALILVPEIGLTPQLLRRFRERLAVPIVEFHSGLTEAERCTAWRMAATGTARVVIGVRSALFTPLPDLGLIVVDEEHDASFKQVEGFHYHARDLALVRAQRGAFPVVLGSATPTLETLRNAQIGRYLHLTLYRRAGTAPPPQVQVLDLRCQRLTHGLAPTLFPVIAEHLSRGEQVLVFLNRRGYAPTLICHECGWVAECQNCDARLTYHRSAGRLHCHHCAAEQALPVVCPSCSAKELQPTGVGTERLEQALQQRFPDYGLVRIDRDTTRKRGSVKQLLDQVRHKQAQILVGTQMLAKGHDFPEVTLVVVVNVDQGLYGVDFRATERLAQLLVQVAGRTGRADKPGRVILQTHNPHHPLLKTLLQGGYRAFAESALAERAAAEWPPFSALALLRAEADDSNSPHNFLDSARTFACTWNTDGAVQILGPIAAPMARRAGHFRAQLLLQAPRRPPLQSLLRNWTQTLETLPLNRRVHWSLDVDPLDLSS